jgi:DNA polymerase elongation subunit (family B)
MSYLSAIVPRQHDDIVRVWERNEMGERITKEFEAPYFFYISDERGKKKTIYDTSVTKIDCGTDRKKFYKKRNDYRDNGVVTWETDIGPELRVLSRQYYEVPAPKINITMLDIENDYNLDQGYSGPKNPYAPINAISMFHEHRNEMVSISVPPQDGIPWTGELLRQACNDIVPLSTDYTTTFYVCKDERELLELIISEIQDSDLLCGWNSQMFDFSFIAKRIEIVLGEHKLRDLSFVGGEAPHFSEEETEFSKLVRKKNPLTPPQTYIRLNTSGRMLADYMILYKKYEASEKPSYKLATISDDVLVDSQGNPTLPKLEYEGSLHDLYIKDFAFFVRYNIRDSEILHGFEQKLAYVELANQMYHMSCGLFQHVGGTLKLAELSIVNHCHHVLKKVVNDNAKIESKDRIEGALVLLPQIGMHEMIGSIDINSLYPTAIRSINISPEKIRGQFNEKAGACLAIANGEDIELTFIEETTGELIIAPADEWQYNLLKAGWAVSGYGTVFDQDAPGIIPSVLTNWFAMRKHYQKLKAEAGERGDKAGIEQYDRLQYVFKIKLNSLYGALSNRFFRFYDLRMGESTTGTGRMILRHQCRKVNEIMEGNYDIDFPMYATETIALTKGYDVEVALHGPKFKGQFQTDCVIYGDTDSTYFKTYAENVDDAILLADRIAEIVNGSYQDFMKKTFLCTPEFDNLVKCGREVVSDRGIFVEKKRYMLHLVDLDGKRVDKCKVMGLDTKKTTLPVAISKKLDKFLERFLKGESWEDVSVSIVDYKKELEQSTDIMEIGLPKGVKNVEDYTERYLKDRSMMIDDNDYYAAKAKKGKTTTLPGHVAASILYNQMLKEHNDRVSMPIMSGLKIKVFNLKVKHGQFKSIALPTDAEFVPTWFYDNFVIDKKLHIEKLVDNPLQNILKAIDKKPPTKSSLVFEEEWIF